jgi:transcriptional regulator with XRE-family HTH domain
MVRKLRNAADMSQAQLAAQCQILGWEISRETLAKIESQIRWVADFELLCLATALNVKVAVLLPEPPKRQHSFSEWFAG